MGRDEVSRRGAGGGDQAAPQGKPQMDAYLNAIRQADEAGDPYWRLMFRCDYCYEATFRDNPPKAIPVAAEFCALLTECAEAFRERSPDGAAEMHLMIMQMGIDPIAFLPQIPMAQWKSMMDEFYRWVKYYHIGLRTYWWQMAQFWRYVDRKRRMSISKSSGRPAGTGSPTAGPVSAATPYRWNC